jgi:uncharacterized membrane protein (DUF106 family)
MEEQDRNQMDNRLIPERVESVGIAPNVTHDGSGSGSHYKYAYNPFKYVFSKMYEHSMWIMGFKWYTIVFVVIVGLFTFALAESIIEQRKEQRKRKKEGMEALNPSNIKEDKKTKKMKKVSFESDKKDNLYSRTREMFIQFYSLLILPSIYALFRRGL